MFEELNERRKAVERNIAKGFGIDCADLDLEKALEDEFEKGRAKKTFAVGDTFTRHGITYKCTGISANTGRPTWSKVKDGEGSKQEQPEKKEDKKDEKKEVKTEQNNSKSKKDDEWFTSFVELFNKPENIKKIAATIPDIDMKKKMEVYKIGSGDSDAFSIFYINTSGVGMSRIFSFDGSGASGLYGWSPNKAVKSIYESNKERLKR